MSCPRLRINYVAFVKNIRAMSKRTAVEYHRRLIGFQDFVIKNYKTTLDNIITRINEGSEDPYEILSDYVSCLQTITIFPRLH
jgi:ABC-type ATPase involved in cell division